MAVGDKELAIQYGMTGALYTFSGDDLHEDLASTPFWEKEERCLLQRTKIGDEHVLTISGIWYESTPAGLASTINTFTTSAAQEAGTPFWASTLGAGSTSTCLLKVYLKSTAIHTFTWTTSVGAWGMVEGGFHVDSYSFPDESPKAGTMWPWSISYKFITIEQTADIMMQDTNTTTIEKK